MSRHLLSPTQRRGNETMAEANYEARKIVADERWRKENFKKGSPENARQYFYLRQWPSL